MIRHVAVVVPAADEEERIGACLTSLASAVDHLRHAIGDGVTTQVLVVVDLCRDRTAEIAGGFPCVRTVAIDARCVGTARGVGARTALPQGLSARDVWLASTDADTQVPTGWLTYMTRAADAGTDLVLGTVRPSLELPKPVRRAWRRAHRFSDGHAHIHGANLGIRASTLRDVGGWRPLPSGEDVDLAERVGATPARVLRTGAIAACTSARVDGRAPAGFSSYLRELSA